MSTKAHIRFATSILRRLGEELNIGFDQGILELVKNAYDADAFNCTIELVEIDQPGGYIRVSDDGYGMTEEEIVDGWLVLGESQKSTNKRTKLGRIAAGNKGLGRLAALRMGEYAELLTRPSSEFFSEYYVAIDWSKFDTVRRVDDVSITIKKIICDNKQHGTEIKISNLRDRLTRMDVKRLARGIILLADPFGDNPSGFHPILKTKDFVDLEYLVSFKYFKESEFHLHAEVDNNGMASAIVKDFNGKTLYAAGHSSIRPKSDKAHYLLPPLQFDLWVFLIDAKTFSTRNISQSEVREWLREFGGVHLYIDGLRVAPYGNPGDDWLNLNLARVRSPEFRPSTNTAIGRVAIENGNSVFIQKTDRTGIIENEAFYELKKFTGDALDWMARERLQEAELRRVSSRVESKESVKKEREIVVKSLDTLPAAQKFAVEKSFRKYEQARENEAIALRNEVILYRTLSTVGIVSAVFAHETSRPIDLIERNTIRIQKKAKTILGDQYESSLKAPVELILAQTALMNGFQSLTLSFVERDKRRNQRLDVHQVILATIENFSSILSERHVNVITSFSQGKPYLRGSAASLETVIANFIVNSLRAFGDRQIGNRNISIKSEINESGLLISFADNGPGIENIEPKSIWLPGETGYGSGTGLGLTIVRDTIRDLGGTVEAIPKGELGGAEFQIVIPILGF
ncbi:sensor histidine kinase [Hymenobacter volaticus]|uniref:histidine kinase n=1 Tax=Hymenobacter volaticus TaxID=2932254 RepID=A0ABY4GFZ1_9BACT|nr:sensor histidine kinase [Hymenobacter volaticus]UOQ69880.1 ATP-binding protein [Hymenobacter volaticus]